jgi:hypothetical protein
VFDGACGGELNTEGTSTDYAAILGTGDGDLFGWDVATVDAGDQFAGFGAIVAGAPGADSDDGRAYVISGDPARFSRGDVELADDVHTAMLCHTGNGGEFGYSVGVGDSVDPGVLRADDPSEYVDVIVGAPLDTPGGAGFDFAGLREGGSAWVFDARDIAGASLAADCAAAEARDAFSQSAAYMFGEDERDYAGWSVASVGSDLNLDGEDEILVGAYGSDRGGGSDAGAAYVVLSR